jgi:hypothetical protein
VPSLKRHERAATTFTLKQPVRHCARHVAQQWPPLAFRPCRAWFVVVLSFGGGWCFLLGDADLGTSASRHDGITARAHQRAVIKGPGQQREPGLLVS